MIAIINCLGRENVEDVVNDLYNSCIFLTGKFTKIRDIPFEMKINRDSTIVEEKFKECFQIVKRVMEKGVFPFIY